MNMSIKEIKEIVKGKEPIPPGQNELSFGNKDKSFKTDLKEELSKSDNLHLVYTLEVRVCL